MAALIGWRALGQSETQPAKPAADITQLSWLAGAWASENDTSRSEEHWMLPRGGSMVGMNRTLRKIADGTERTAFYEFLRIESGRDGIVYLASPKGRQPPTPFRLVESADVKVVFENPEHDFPQRIIYERSGDTL